MKNVKIIFVFVFIVGFIFLVGANSTWDSHLNKLIENQGVFQGDVQNISELNKGELPSEIFVSNVEDSNVGIYDVKYFDGVSNKSIYVISFATQDLSESPITKSENMEYLTFSGNEEVLGEYLIMDDGSIVGLSSVVEFSGSGEVIVEVFVNSDLMFISNNVFDSGDNFDYDIQSSNIDEFSVGDLISVRFRTVGDISVSEVNSVVKIKL